MTDNTMTGEIRLRVSLDLLKRLAARADKERRTMPDLIRLILEDGVPADPFAASVAAMWREAGRENPHVLPGSQVPTPPALPGGKTRKVGKALSVPVQPAKPAKKAKRENFFEAV